MDLSKIPTPRFAIGGFFIYCPHSSQENSPGKVVHTLCKFKTKNIRKYRRHYMRNHL